MEKADYQPQPQLRIHYSHEEHDKFFELCKSFNFIIVRCNPGVLSTSSLVRVLQSSRPLQARSRLMAETSRSLTMGCVRCVKPASRPMCRDGAKQGRSILHVKLVEIKIAKDFWTFLRAERVMPALFTSCSESFLQDFLKINLESWPKLVSFSAAVAKEAAAGLPKRARNPEAVEPKPRGQRS